MQNNHKISAKMIFTSIFCMLCILMFLIINFIGNIIVNDLQHERVADKWNSEGGYAHISLYLSETEKNILKEDIGQTQNQLDAWYHGIDAKLKEASILPKENPNARQIVYAYSATGNIHLKTDYGNVEAKAYGVGGDFFLFHQFELLYGTYFSEADLNNDKVVLDEELAWKLYGSSNIVGKYIMINEIPHLISGVIKSEKGYFNDKAGNNLPTIYLSHDVLYESGSYYGLEAIEYLVPNPVSNFAYNIIEEFVGDRQIEIIQNQNRFSVFSLYKTLLDMPIRSMGLSGITLPYWENIARAYEDILTILLVLKSVLLLIPLVIVIIFLWKKWINRKVRVGDIYLKIKDYVYSLRVKKNVRRNYKKNKGKEFELKN